jgi:hypothetical protein
MRKITEEIHLRSYRRNFLRFTEFQETQAGPRRLRQEIVRKFYGNTTRTAVADTRSKMKVIAA